MNEEIDLNEKAKIAQKIIVKGTGFAFKEKLIKLWTIANEYHGYFNIIKTPISEVSLKWEFFYIR